MAAPGMASRAKCCLDCGIGILDNGSKTPWLKKKPGSAGVNT
jgi:hypothetical protein